MRILDHNEISQIVGAEGDGVPMTVVTSTIAGGILGAFFNGAIHEVALHVGTTTCLEQGGAASTCFLQAASFAQETVGGHFPLHVAGFAIIGLLASGVYTLCR